MSPLESTEVKPKKKKKKEKENWATFNSQSVFPGPQVLLSSHQWAL